MKGIITALLLMASMTITAQEKKKEEPVMTKNKKEYVVNTTTLCNTRGFKGTTPLMVTFNKKKIVKIEALPNIETPRFFQRVVQEMFPKFNDLEMDKSKDVDCVTGATMSSKAVKDHVAAAIKYYNENK